jgi:chymotrypsin
MKLIVAAILVVLAISAHAEDEEEWKEIDWNRVVPIHERPGFWDGRNLKKMMEPLAPTRGGRIVGGQVVVPHTHPYQAGLLILYRGSTYSCGGVLISTTRVLTAAHCIVGSTSTQVILGAHQITTVESTQQRRTVLPGNYRNHPQYNENSLINDISVMILPTAVTITNQVRTIPRAGAQAPNFAGVTATMSGWGQTTDAGGSTNVLRSTTNVVISNAQCLQYYGSEIFASTLCTSSAGGRGVCFGISFFCDDFDTFNCYYSTGDSGGPLTAMHNNARHLIGIVSFVSSRGCQAGSPNGFARVSSFG